MKKSILTCTQLAWTLTLLLAFSLTVAATAQNLPREDVIDVPAVGEGLSLHNLFQTNMVLQRDKPIHIWGWAAAGEEVTVEFAGQSAKATADADRKWHATLPAMPANTQDQKLIVRGKNQTLTLENILVGDVWVLGGQSNMEFELAKVENGNLEIVSANYPQIRILTVPYHDGPREQNAFPRLHEWSGWFNRHFRKGDWDVCSPEIARELSAIGYVFARRLHTASNVPIGVIDTSRGGTTVETWAPEGSLRQIDTPPVKALLTQWDDKVQAWDPEADLANRVSRHNEYVERMKKEGKEIPADRITPTDLRPGPTADTNYPGNCYEGMIAPLAGLSVKGAIFHQGYNNCFNGTEGAMMYRDVFPQMIAAWREAFNDPEMPFGILSLCTAGQAQTRENYSELMSDPGAYIREAQYQTFLDLYKAGDKNVGFVSTYDLRRRWYHPQLKLPAGERIARWALATQYGMDRGLPWMPPVLEEMIVEDGKVVLKFDRDLDAIDNGLPIEGFAIAGEDRRFHPADADHLVTGEDDRGRPQYDRSTIVLTSMMVPKPTHYRYAWARSPMGNVQVSRNSDVPLATQRSDDWPLEQIPLGVVEVSDGEKMNRQQQNQLRQALQQQDLDRRKAEAKQLLSDQQQ